MSGLGGLNPLNQVKSFGHKYMLEHTSNFSIPGLNPLNQVKSFGLRDDWGGPFNKYRVLIP